MDLVNEINELSQKMTEGVHLMAKYGKEYAKAEQDYQIKKMQEVLRLKDEGVPVTLIQIMIKGAVAKEMFARDACEVMYKSAQENVNVLKLKIRICEEQLKREWGSGD